MSRKTQSDVGSSAAWERIGRPSSQGLINGKSITGAEHSLL